MSNSASFSCRAFCIATLRPQPSRHHDDALHEVDGDHIVEDEPVSANLPPLSLAWLTPKAGILLSDGMLSFTVWNHLNPVRFKLSTRSRTRALSS